METSAAADPKALWLKCFWAIHASIEIIIGGLCRHGSQLDQNLQHQSDSGPVLGIFDKIKSCHFPTAHHIQYRMVSIHEFVCRFKPMNSCMHPYTCVVHPHPPFRHSALIMFPNRYVDLVNYLMFYNPSCYWFKHISFTIGEQSFDYIISSCLREGERALVIVVLQRLSKWTLSIFYWYIFKANTKYLVNTLKDAHFVRQ